jgi:integrase
VNKKRAEVGKRLLPTVTPHTLRRTWASLALLAGRDVRWVMAQCGHTDARLTLQVYAQVVQRQRVGLEADEVLGRGGRSAWPASRSFGAAVAHA